ncbi:uncharacterized protein LOC105177319 [Sesamum indicum]|uniref:Uncharacterized protein LOC105177319 n=1 Tax=Sesamum indicum TaxID=4182 RepID=A0A6I9UKZ4_SESIN|nr:uncharacterized protein LOC105177319 [Sesamum indicum]XP_011098737.1 uncharacterized protein LOC105177319 [Sesamum indicum]
MSRPSEQHSTDQKNATKGTEVFVGGLARSISEEKIHKVFSSCGEIMEVRMMRDRNGNLKGFCFVRFATKEDANKAVREKSGIVLDGKKIGVLPASEQDTLYFGNLNKAWSAEEFERIVLQVFPDIESVDLVMLKDAPPGQKHRNRGFAFVKFRSHAAASRAQRVGSQPDFRLGNLHPAVQWAEEEPEIDPKELAKIKIAFVRNLPVDAEENYLKELFESFGKVEKVVVSKKGSFPVGFVHFAERLDLERAIKELNEKTVQGPNGAPLYKLQVEVARPMDRSRKRIREDSENSSVQAHFKLRKEEPSLTLSIRDSSHVQKELESADPYEDAVISLPVAVKERLLGILRLGIATRFDIDIRSLRSLKELPESIAISVLDQFMLCGAGLQNKGEYLAGLISKHLVDKVGQTPSLVSLSKVADTTRSEPSSFIFWHQMSPSACGPFTSHAHSSSARSDIHASNYSAVDQDFPLSSRTQIGRVDEKGPEFLLPNRSFFGSQSVQIPRLGTLEARGHSALKATPGESISYGSQSIQIPRIGTLEASTHSPLEATPGQSISYGRVGLRAEERLRSHVQEGPGSSTSYARLGSTGGLSAEERLLSHVQEGFSSPVSYARLGYIGGLRAEERLPSHVQEGPSSSASYARLGSIGGLRAEERLLSHVQEGPSSSASYVRLGSIGGLRAEERLLSHVQEGPSSSTSYAGAGIGLSPNISVVGGRQAPRPQIRFDPFTGEPYKFDPFTGEPIRPANATRQF